MEKCAPVAFIFFNKEKETRAVFGQIRKARPEKLYLISDAGRNQKEAELVANNRRMVEDAIDWNCDVSKIYADENMGCRDRIVSGLSRVFENEESAIIIEDDCFPNLSFFPFCSRVLEHYKDTQQIMMVAGTNLVPKAVYKIENDYALSGFGAIWGWATWRRAWSLYDVEMRNYPELRDKHLLEHYYGLKEMDARCSLLQGFEKCYHGEIDTWDYQWVFMMWSHLGLSVVPRTNMIKNIGFNVFGATHTVGDLPDAQKKVYEDFNENEEELKEEIHFLDYIVRDREYDYYYSKLYYRRSLKSRVYWFLRDKARLLKKIIIKDQSGGDKV